MSQPPTECPQGNHGQRYVDNSNADSTEQPEVSYQLAQSCCAYCGRTDGKLSKCSSCKNEHYCSKECQKLAWKKHKPRCKELKKIREDAKSQGISSQGKCNMSLNAKKVDARVAASGHGSVHLVLSPKPDMLPHSFTTKSNSDPTRNAYEVQFRKLEELDPTLQFVLACTFLNDLKKAQDILPVVLQHIPEGFSVSDIKLAGPDFAVLDLACRFGNTDVVEWMCTDDRTKCMVEAATCKSTPVAWAVYTGQVSIAKLLVSHGADPNATNSVCFGEKPPLFMAAENGQLLAMQWLVDEMGQDLNMVSAVHGTVLDACKAKGFGKSNMLDSHRACSDWVHSKR